jgi:hypothetical protein
MRSIQLGIACMLALPPVSALAWPGDDVSVDATTCGALPDAGQQAACLKCVGSKGKHFHSVFDACHATDAKLPRPPATVTRDVELGCKKAFWADPDRQASCSSCVDDGGIFVTKTGRCDDPDPKKMKSKPALDHATCDQVKDGVQKDECHACISTGRTFHRADGRCTGNRLDDKAGDPIADAASCRGTTVAAERRRGCAACMKSGVGIFEVIGPRAGECSKDGPRFAAKFALPAESLATGFYTEAGCRDNVTVDQKLQTKCLACTKKDQVFVTDGKKGSCMKPAAAAKRAPAPAVTATTTPPPITTPPPVAYQAPSWASGSATQEKVGDTTVLRVFAGTRQRGAASIIKLPLEPKTEYTLRIRVKGVGTSANSVGGAKLEYYLKKGSQRFAGWTKREAYAGAGDWRTFEQTFITDEETATAATGADTCKVCWGGQLVLWAELEAGDTGSYLFDDVALIKKSDGTNLVINGDFEAAEAGFKGKAPGPLP